MPNDERAYRLMTEAAAVLIEGADPEALVTARKMAQKVHDSGLPVPEVAAFGMRIFMGAILIDQDLAAPVEDLLDVV